jgi:hypothetical protein
MFRMEPPAVELTVTGLVLSVVVWSAGAWSLTRATATAVSSVPDSWRERFGPEYETALAFRVRDAFVSRRTLTSLVVWLAVFSLLTWADVLLIVQVGAAAAYAAWETVRDSRSRRERAARLEAEGLESTPPNARLRRWYDGSNFATLLGFFTAACFTIQLAVELVGG